MTRFNLPEIDFLSIDAEEIENIMVAEYESLVPGVSLSEADPRRKVFQAVTMILTMLGNNIDYTGKMNLLPYAVDNYLDHKGIDKGLERLPAKSATTTIRFIMNAQENFTIPSTTRLTIENLQFAIDTDTHVAAGATQVDITATCTETGVIGNGYLPNQITKLVDNDELPWVIQAYNITTSEGGSDIESDDSFAERIRLFNESYSTAGPELAYVYHAQSANSRVIDVKAISNNPGEVELVPLMEGGELPTETEQAEILEGCSDKKVRPLTDKVIITLPEQVSYDLSITYYLPQGSVGLQESTSSSINEAINEYLLWQKNKLGRGIDPSELYAKMQTAGARRISVEPNEYVPLEDYQVAKENNIEVIYGGIIND